MFTALFLVLVCLGIDFLFSAGVVWLLCWLLPAIGIVSIGSFVIAFSWKLVLVVWLIVAILRSIFRITVKN